VCEYVCVCMYACTVCIRTLYEHAYMHKCFFMYTKFLTRINVAKRDMRIVWFSGQFIKNYNLVAFGGI